MVLASAPSTPDRGTAPPYIRRSFTAPIKTAKGTTPTHEADAERAETLFAHHAGRIVSFSIINSSTRRHSSVSDGQSELREEPMGTLPWASLTERTIAAGPLRIYRVMGSVAFLNSGAILRPILVKSQCWCVDGVSKFVLRIKPNSYYRIELPNKSSQDEEKVEEFKAVLANVLQYEKTPCPFKRSFTVELPEPPKTPLTKRPWRPTLPEQTMPIKSPEVDRLVEPRNLEAPSHRALDIQDPEDAPSTSQLVYKGRKIEELTMVPSDTSSSGSTDNEQDSEATDDTRFTHKELHEKGYEEPKVFNTPARPQRLTTTRIATAPPQLTLRTHAPTPNSKNVHNEARLRQKAPSLSSSVESFHSFHSPISPLPCSSSSEQEYSSPGSQYGLVIPRSRHHNREASDLTVTDSSTVLWDKNAVKTDHLSSTLSISDPVKTPTLLSDRALQEEDHQDEASTPSPTTKLRKRRMARVKRSHSPLPSSTNLYSPYSPRNQISGHHLTTAILQRTCSILLGPPVQLVALMLRIAAKISRGALRGSSFGFGEGGQKIPCSWDFSSDDSDELWEDDYGISLGKTVSGKEVRDKDIGGSWEID